MQRITLRLLTTVLTIFITFGYAQAFAAVTNTITTPTPNETVTLPASITGTATATDGINEVVVGIRDAVTKLWWNEGSWGNWVLNPAQLTFTTGSTDAQWSYDFDPVGTNGSGEYRVYARTRDSNNVLSPSMQVSFIGEEGVTLTLDTTVLVPVSGQMLPTPSLLNGTATSPVGIETVLVGIRDVVTKLWWNEGSWGDWVLNPAIVTPAGGTEVNWNYSFNPNGTSGSGEYRIYARAKEITGTLAASVQVPFQAVTNNPPIADAGMDQQVYVGQTIALDGSGSNDPNGDPITYSWSFSSCPDYCPYLPSSNTVTPSFRVMAEGDYVLQLQVSDGVNASLTDEVVISAGPLTPSNPSLLTREWKLGQYGTYIGNTGLSITDIDNDGSLEIITTGSQFGFGSNSMWYVVGQDGNGGYHQIWSSDPYSSAITRMIVADADTNGISEIYVGFDDGTVRVYDGQFFTETGSVNIAGTISAMAVSDADGDGVVDIIISDGIKLYSYSTTNYTEQWQLANYGGIDMAIGNVDDDLSPEIVTTSSNGHGYVIDGASKLLEWDYIDGFGTRVRLGNLDNDAREEIVGAEAWNIINVFDAEIRTPAWGLPTDTNIGGVLITDENNDGIDEIIYGDAQGGKIHCIDAQTRLEKWVTPYALAGDYNMVSYIGLEDLDGDGIKELVWGSGGYSTGADHLNIVDSSTFVLEWQSTHIDPPFSAVDIGDVDDDGEDEIVMASFESNSGYDQGIIYIFNAQTHALEISGQVTHNDWMGIRSVRIGDVDNDGETELVVTTGNIYDGLIQVYNGKDLTLERESLGYNGNYFTTVEIGDVDNDGKMEIIAGQGKEHTGATGNHLIVFDGATLAEEWRSISLTSAWGGVSDISLADSDNDGNTEIIAAYGENRVAVYDGVTHQLDWLGDVKALSVEANDIDSDGVVEILVGRIDGFIDIFDGVNFNLEDSISIPIANYNSSLNERIEALKIADLDHDGTQELLVSIDNKLSVFNPENVELLWQSNDLGSKLGWYNQIVVGNIDNDASSEIVFGSSTGLFQYD